MRTALTAAALAVVIGHLWLVVTSWKSRSVLAGFLGAMGIPVVLFAVVAGPARNFRVAVVLIAAIMLVVGSALYGLGQSIQRLLDRDPADDG
jgi:multisubunit Na+/H+ antiporter MnhE subunit